MLSFKRELYVLKNKVYMYLIQNIQLQKFFKFQFVWKIFVVHLFTITTIV